MRNLFGSAVVWWILPHDQPAYLILAPHSVLVLRRFWRESPQDIANKLRGFHLNQRAFDRCHSIIGQKQNSQFRVTARGLYCVQSAVPVVLAPICQVPNSP